MHVQFWIVLFITFTVEGQQLVKQLLTGASPRHSGSMLAQLKDYPTLVGLLLAAGCSFISFNLAQSILGIILLIRAADILISGAEVVALKANIPPIVIGVLIIGLGTSMPELFVNVISALKGDTDIAFGNIVGSNISNMGLVIGIAGWLAGRIKIQKSIITAEIPVMMAAALLVILQVCDFPPLADSSDFHGLSRQDGIVMLLGMALYLLYTFHVIANVPANPEVRQKYSDRYGKEEEIRAWLSAIGKILLGVIGLYFGGDFTVTGATSIAVGLGAGTLVVGVIIGVGTSLPELATAISSVMKNQTDLMIGNVVGSNIFNVLLILGITALIEPIPLTAGVAGHLVFLLLATGIFFIALGTKKTLSRPEAIMLTFLGISYLSYSIITG
ncbi:MAG: sodium:calcium antiporter [bacterium]|nr:sodium:calcium antiporter [bacterium]